MTRPAGAGGDLLPNPGYSQGDSERLHVKDIGSPKPATCSKCCTAFSPIGLVRSLESQYRQPSAGDGHAHCWDGFLRCRSNNRLFSR